MDGLKENQMVYIFLLVVIVVIIAQNNFKIEQIFASRFDIKPGYGHKTTTQYETTTSTTVFKYDQIGIDEQNDDEKNLNIFNKILEIINSVIEYIKNIFKKNSSGVIEQSDDFNNNIIDGIIDFGDSPTKDQQALICNEYSLNSEGNLEQYTQLEDKCDLDKCEYTIETIRTQGGCSDSGVKISDGVESEELLCGIFHPCDAGDSCTKSTRKSIELTKGQVLDVTCKWYHSDFGKNSWEKENCNWFRGISAWSGGDGGVQYTISYKKYNCISSGVSVDYDNSFSKYEMLRRSMGISDIYLQETVYYDYSSSNIRNKINNIKGQCGDNIDKCISLAQKDAISLGYCAGGKGCLKCPQPASQTLSDGMGICSTKSQYLTAVLRGMGIASRVASGRATSSTCPALFSLFKYEMPTPVPKVQMEGFTNDISMLGWISHAWVEVWTPDRGWVIAETVGLMKSGIFEQPCSSYQKFAHIDNGVFVTDYPESSYSSILGNACYSRMFRTEIKCLDWSNEGCWVPDEFRGV